MLRQRQLVDEEPPQAVTASGTHPVLSTAVRTVLPIAGSVAGALSPIPGGTYLGGALAGAGAEVLGSWLDGEEVDPKEVALQGIVSGLPFFGRARTPLAGAVMRGAQAATVGAGSELVREMQHDQPIDLSRVLKRGALSGVVGAPFGGLEGALARRATLANLRLEQPDVPPTAVPDLPVAPAPFAPLGTVEPQPTLGQMGLPGRLGLGEAREVGALSAADVNDLAPSIIDRVDTTDDVKTLIQNLASRNSSMIEDARRGVQTTAQREAAAQPIVAELAQRLGTDPDSFAKNLRQRGEAVNAEQMQALKTVFTSVTGDFYDVAKQVAAGDSDPQTLLKMAKAMNLAKGVLSQKAGAAAEMGRGLNALRGVQQMERLQGKALEALLSQAGTSEDALRNIATKAADLAETGDPSVLTKFLREITETSTEDKIHEAWMSGLMGVRTQIINNTSNALMLGVRLPQEALAGSMDALRASVTGAPRERFLGEVVADTLGMTRGLMGGARAALRAFKTEMPQWDATARTEVRPFAIKGTAGKVVRTNLRLLLAADEFWKAFGGEGAIYAQAYREAAQEGYSGTARLQRMADTIGNERGRLKEAVTPEVLYRTFQSPSALADRALGLREWQAPIVGVKPFRWLFPFVRTPINVVSAGAEHSPLGMFSTLAKAFDGRSAGEIEDSAARAVLGMGLGGAVVAHAASGGITGAGPSDRAEAQALRATGWQPYSIKVGDRYYSYNRLEPLGSTLAFAADAAEAMRDPLVDPEEAAARVGAHFMKRMTDLPFLTGLQTILDAREDPERFGSAFVKRFASSFVPTMVAEAARAVDPVARDTSASLTDMLASRVPGFSDDLPPLRNIWGEPVQRGPGGLATFLPMDTGAPVQTDPASVEVRRLVTATGFGVGSPARSLTTQGKAEPLTPEEYDRFSEQAGQLAKTLVTRLVTAPNYQRIQSDEKRARLVTNVIGKARDVARHQLRLQKRMQQGGTPLPLAVP